MHTPERRRTRTALAAVLGVLAFVLTMSPFTGASSAATSSAATDRSSDPAAAPATSGAKPTIVLVHGAFADASGWAGVITRLQNKGYPVYAPATPLRSVSGDSAYLKTFLATIEGPVVLVGHSYGGVVITNAAKDNPNVTALVYIAAFAPAEGETVEQASALGAAATTCWTTSTSARSGPENSTSTPTSSSRHSTGSSPRTCRRARPG